MGFTKDTKSLQNVLPTNVTRLGYFVKLLATIFLQK